MNSGRLPDFFVIGAMKAGTTTLFRHLQRHPRIFMPELKEPDFFVGEKNWLRGMDWYTSLFEPAPPDALLGEGSTNYSKARAYPGVPERLREYVPEAKLIYLLRDPVERMRSHYVHSVLSGRERRSPYEAFDPASGYLDVSRYGFQLAKFEEHFPSSQILVILTEDMRDDPADVLDRTLAFLTLDPYDFPDLQRREHVSEERRATRRLGWLVRRNHRLLSLARQVLPERVRRPVRRALTRPMDTQQIEVPDSAFDAVREQLAADVDLLSGLRPLALDKWTSLQRVLKDG
jgi:hypothetical protein